MTSPDDAILPDVLRPGLTIVFCGMAAGKKSAAVGAYYAGPGNRFWSILHAIGLTPRQLQPAEFQTLPQYGIGLTDLEKRQSGNDDELDIDRIDPAGLRERVLRFAPVALAFNSKTAAQQFYGVKTLSYGPQRDRIGVTAVYVLPSTSGRNAHWPKLVQHWHALPAWLAAVQNGDPIQR